MEDWQGLRVDQCYPSQKDLADSSYFLCLCQFCSIMLSPLIVTSLTSSFFTTILVLGSFFYSCNQKQELDGV